MQDMVKLIQQLSYRHSTSNVFSDFLEMSALAFSNVVDKSQFEEREKRYMEIVGKYKKEEVYEFPTLLGMLVNHLEEAPRDVLGEIFHDLELHNERKGQFFTPYPICRMMAKMVIGESYDDIISKYGFITLSEPACGMGAMVIAAAHELKDRDINYQQVTHTTAIDIDPLCVHGTYVQFSLLHIPAVVIHGDSLSMEEWSHWYTPAHVLGNWDQKLKFKQRYKMMKGIIEEITTPAQETVMPPDNNTNKPRQSNSSGSQLKIF
jgi:hypothetical protein